MALASEKYDLILNGIGYTLISESYRKRGQQPFNPRFSTGDPSLTDLSFWQFMSQEAWDGGAGQLDFSSLDKIQKSSGWSFLTGYPKLCGGSSVVSASPTELANVEAIGGTTCHVPAIHRFLRFGRSADGYSNLVLIGPGSSGFTADSTRTTLVAGAIGTTGLTQVLGFGSALWQRQHPDTAPGFLIQGITGSIKIYDPGWNVADTITPTVTPRCIVPINYDNFLAIGPATFGGIVCLGVERVQFTANTWTEAQELAKATDCPHVPSPHAAIDSNGMVYVVLPSRLTLSTYEGFFSSVMLISAADALATQAPAISKIIDYPDYCLTGAFAIAGTTYMIGAKLNKSSATPKYRATVLKFPNTVVWESEYESATLLNVLPRAFHSDTYNEVLFANGNLDSGCPISICRLTADSVEEVFALPESETGTVVDIAALGRLGNTIFAYDRGQNRILKATSDPSTSRLDTNNLILTTSRYGGNTPLIDKTLYSITLSLSEAIPAAQTLTVKVNGTTVGTVTNSDGTEVELVLTSEVTASYFEVSYTMLSTATWSGEIRKEVLRYVPTQFKKFMWGMGIRCDSNLKLIDGTKEAHTGKNLYDHLITAWQSNIPVAFVDVDGTSYTVLVTDFDQRRPLINDRAGVHEESLMFLELLQI